VLLGLGSDGHTASLFPGSAALEERVRWVVAPFVASVRAHRITLTLPVLERAREVVFLVSGAEKAPALTSVLAPAPGVAPPPAARVRPEAGGPIWIVDRAAASGVEAASGARRSALARRRHGPPNRYEYVNEVSVARSA